MRRLDQDPVTFTRVSAHPFRCRGSVGDELSPGGLGQDPGPLAVDDAHGVEHLGRPAADAAVRLLGHRSKLRHLAEHGQQSFPVAEMLCACGMYLPSASSLTPHDIEFIADAIKQIQQRGN